MRKKKLLFGLAAAGILLLVAACLQLSRTGHFSLKPPLQHKPYFSANSAAYPSRLSAYGNRLVNAAGQTVVLRGLMPPDPARLNEKGRFSRAFLQQMQASGANAIRIPVHPERWEQDPDYLWRYLDPLVAWSGEMGIYAIIDLHFIGNVATGSGEQMPDIHTGSKEFTLAFWRQVAGYFRDAPNVIFEIVNEPQSITPAVWRGTAEEIIAQIRAAGANQLVIVGGVEYARDLSWVLDQPVEDGNVAYAAHIYPAHPSSAWDAWFGEVARQRPVVVTEWGWVEASSSPQTSYLVGSENTYGDPLLGYLQERGIGWVACWYDDEWLPAMFQKGSQELTGYGKFVQRKLIENP